jgi:NAD-dependent dihydropyrimidine dehydrogenase PreA subunit
MSLIHVITGENSHVRRWTLYLFARYIEMPLLGIGYQLLRGRHRRWGQNPLVRAALTWGVTAPFGYVGDTAYPMPTSEMLTMIDALDGPIAVGPCRCRSAHRACDHPIDTDIVIRTGVQAWMHAFPHEYRLIDKEEAKQIVADCGNLGMWPMVFVHCPVDAHRDPAATDNEYVICNCCTCGCVPYILNRELGQRAYPLLRGEFTAVTDPARCQGHGACVPACPFDVRAVIDGKAQLVDECFGCGLCVAACPEAAIQTAPRNSGDS